MVWISAQILIDAGVINGHARSNAILGRYGEVTMIGLIWLVGNLLILGLLLIFLPQTLTRLV